MKSIQNFINLALGAACLILSITSIFVGKSTMQAQIDLQKRQNEIQIELQNRQAEVNRGITSDKVGGAILQDMAVASVKNDKIKNVLSQNGYTVSANPSPTPEK